MPEVQRPQRAADAGVRRLMSILRRHVAILLALSGALIVAVFLPLSWSRPYCMSQVDGPDYAGLGIPLPYLRYSGVSSMEFSAMPHVYLLNLAALTLVLWLLTRLIARRIRTGSKLEAGVAVLGLTGVVMGCGFVALVVATGSWRPVGSIGDTYGSWSEYRPVGLAHSMSPDCVKSSFWFPEASRRSD